MSEHVPFTDNFSDLSNADGYQFEFRCERCGTSRFCACATPTPSLPTASR
jgi:hypothetical protein